VLQRNLEQFVGPVDDVIEAAEAVEGLRRRRDLELRDHRRG